METKYNNIYKNNLKIQSKIHSEIYHTVKINLFCYERMPSEEAMNRKNLSKTTKNNDTQKN